MNFINTQLINKLYVKIYLKLRSLFNYIFKLFKIQIYKI
jgi:hypothetical protein